MAKSKIVVSFNGIPLVNQILVLSNSLSGFSLYEKFVTIRYSSSNASVGISAEDSAFKYYQAISADYNGTGLYNISVLGNEVTIVANQSNVVFTETANTTGVIVETTITNEVEDEDLVITNVTYSEADSNPCNYIKVNVFTNELATKILSPISVDPNIDNPFSFDYIRGSSINITCENATNITSKSVVTPSILSASNLLVDLYETPNGANATINLDESGINASTLQYSLDNVTWQTSNYFSGLLEGNYTVYVKDIYGCSVSLDFTVNVFTPDISVTSPFTYLAKELSIRFKKNVDLSSNYINEENTLSCEEKVRNAYRNYHLFQTNDTITIQFLSNYENLSANIIKEDGSKDALSVVKRSTNLGAVDMRDAIYYNATNDKVGVYFASGNTYNYYTGEINGEYALNGALPNYGYINNYIYLNGIGWKKIIDIIYSDEYNSDVLIIEHTYIGEPTIVIASSIYNRKNYEVYEFQIEMSDYEDEEIQIEILQSDVYFGEYNYLSEKIKVAESWDDTIEMIWYNVDDTFVFYSTGLKNKARLYFDSFSASDESELEIHKTDISTLLISSESYETMDLELSQISTGIKRQLTKAFLHKELFIDGIQYVSKSVPESENIKFTNQYTMKASLIKTGNVYNSEWDGQGNAIEGAELIALLKNEDKYIKLQ